MLGCGFKVNFGGPWGLLWGYVERRSLKGYTVTLGLEYGY